MFSLLPRMRQITIIFLIIFQVNMAKADEQFTSISAHSFKFESIDGKDVHLSKFKGKVLMVVNTASKCGFVGQYADLQELYDKYKTDGFEIIAVPSNDFGDQEPGTAAEIADFCETNFQITFPLMNKVSVVGDNAHPFYKWAADQVSYFGKPKWNFHKYLIGKDGRLIDWFSTATNPLSGNITSAIEEELHN